VVLALRIEHHALRNLWVHTVKVFDTSKLDSYQLGETDRLHVYNGFDCCITKQVLDVIKPQLDNVTSSTYEFSKSLQAPVLEMDLRGMLVNQVEATLLDKEFEQNMKKVERNLYRILTEGVGQYYSWSSPAQLKRLFYEAMSIPPVKRKGKVTTDRAALESLMVYFYAEPIIRHVLFLRDLKKLREVLQKEIDPDGRIRTSYNIAGTESGRFSSSVSFLDTGTNMQNLTEKLRKIYIADPGKKLAYIDAQQAESYAVGAIIWQFFGDSKYLDVCGSGDLHTNVAKLIWPHLGWTGDRAKDREIADQHFYRDFSYRDMSKRGGHGTNYGGLPPTMARHLKVETRLMIDFQEAYFREFPGIRQYHYWCAKELQVSGQITTLTGRRRFFMGRRDDDATVREAIAYSPQEIVSYVVNQGMLQVWRHCKDVQILQQTHDALLIQYDEDKEDEVIPRVRETLKVSVDIGRGRSLIIPNDCAVGWNWGKAEKDGKIINIDGLMKYKGHDNRSRQVKPQASLLDRKF
jgi:DNA polymerase-1